MLCTSMYVAPLEYLVRGTSSHGTARVGCEGRKGIRTQISFISVKLGSQITTLHRQHLHVVAIKVKNDEQTPALRNYNPSRVLVRPNFVPIPLFFCRPKFLFHARSHRCPSSASPQRRHPVLRAHHHR
jgi:hypothetical protein